MDAQAVHVLTDTASLRRNYPNRFEGFGSCGWHMDPVSADKHP